VPPSHRTILRKGNALVNRTRRPSLRIFPILNRQGARVKGIEINAVTPSGCLIICVDARVDNRKPDVIILRSGFLSTLAGAALRTVTPFAEQLARGP